MSLAKSISEKNYPVKKKIANKDLLFVTKHKSAVQPTSLNCTLLWLFLVIRDTMTTRSFKLSPPNFNLLDKVPGYCMFDRCKFAAINQLTIYFRYKKFFFQSRHFKQITEVSNSIESLAFRHKRKQTEENSIPLNIAVIIEFDSRTTIADTHSERPTPIQ